MTKVVRCYDRRDGTLLREERMGFLLAHLVAWSFPRIELIQARLWPDRYGYLPPTVYLIDCEGIDP